MSVQFTSTNTGISQTRADGGSAPNVGRRLRSKVYTNAVKREARADPRFYENDRRYPSKRLAGMYDVDVTTVNRWKREFQEEQWT